MPKFIEYYFLNKNGGCNENISHIRNRQIYFKKNFNG